MQRDGTRQAKRRLLSGVAVGLVLAWAVSARAQQSAPLRLLFTGDVMGDYESCDCKDQPLGGIAQRAHLVGQLRQADGDTVLLDSGNLLARSHVAVGPDAEMWRKIGAMTLVDAYSLMGVDAVNVGPLDLAFGLDYLLKIQHRSSFPWLSTNLVDPATGDPLFTPSLTVERDGVRITFIGLVPGEMEGAGYRSTDPVETASVAAERARAGGSDLVIVLSALGQDEEQRLARKVKEIDLVLGCGDRSRTDPPPRVRGVPLIHPGTRGKWVVEVALTDGRGKDRFSARFWPVERGAPVDEDVDAMVREAAVRRDDPLFIEAGSESVP
jgi:2',3'-cyclic-nucleotide 2'-phosphodiesterase (5'-nucleotidase family)